MPNRYPHFMGGSQNCTQGAPPEKASKCKSMKMLKPLMEQPGCPHQIVQSEETSSEKHSDSLTGSSWIYIKSTTCCALRPNPSLEKVKYLRPCKMVQTRHSGEIGSNWRWRGVMVTRGPEDQKYASAASNACGQFVLCWTRVPSLGQKCWIKTKNG